MLEPRSQAMVRGILGRGGQKDRDDEAPVGKLTGQGSSSKHSGRSVPKPIADLRPTIAAGPSQDFLPSPGGTAQDGAHTRYQLCPGAQPGQVCVCVHWAEGQLSACPPLLNTVLGSVFSKARAASLHSCHTSLAWHSTSMASSLVSPVPVPPQSFVNEA